MDRKIRNNFNWKFETLNDVFCFAIPIPSKSKGLCLGFWALRLFVSFSNCHQTLKSEFSTNTYDCLKFRTIYWCFIAKTSMTCWCFTIINPNTSASMYYCKNINDSPMFYTMINLSTSVWSFIVKTSMTHWCFYTLVNPHTSASMFYWKNIDDVLYPS